MKVTVSISPGSDATLDLDTIARVLGFNWCKSIVLTGELDEDIVNWLNGNGFTVEEII